jgi:DHA2 family multidrug resistance protein
MGRFDARGLVSFGVVWLAGVALIRAGFASNVNYGWIAMTFFAQGLAMPFFFIPTTQLALTSVKPQETASAAGLSNFLRTTSAAFATSLTITAWTNMTARNHANMAGALNDPTAVQSTLAHGGLTSAQALSQIDGITQGQAVMLATDQMFLVTTVAFVIAASVVWLGPKPNLTGGPVSGGH